MKIGDQSILERLRVRCGGLGVLLDPGLLEEGSDRLFDIGRVVAVGTLQFPVDEAEMRAERPAEGACFLMLRAQRLQM